MRVEHLTPHESLALDEFLARVDREMDPEDPQRVWSFRHDLAALALDPNWLFQIMLKTVTDRSAHVLNAHQPSYFIIHRCGKYTLRANIWLPERANAVVAQLENAAFSYDFPHDHNFDILSVTCLGSGYETDVYRHLAGRDRTLEIGDVVDVEFVGRLRQPLFTALYYEKFTDIHTQLPPQDVVITLNLLPHVQSDNMRSQYLFENLSRTSLRVIGRPSSPEGRELSAIRFLGKVRSLTNTRYNELEHLLEHVARRHANPTVALAAERMLEAVHRGPDTLTSLLIEEIEERRANIKYYQVAEKAREWRSNG